MTPRGIEILVKKASVDGAFKRHLLAERSGAAARIGLELDSAEAAMLDVIPETHLVKIIAEAKVSPKLTPVFMGYAATAMLAAVGGFAVVSVPSNGEDGLDIVNTSEKTPTNPTVAFNRDIGKEGFKGPIAGTGYISGIVTDQNGNVIEGAVVVIEGSGLFALTDADGYYLINHVPVGFWVVSASKEGYGEMTVSNVRVMDGLRNNVSFRIDEGITMTLGIRPDLPHHSSIEDKVDPEYLK